MTLAATIVVWTGLISGWTCIYLRERARQRCDFGAEDRWKFVGALAIGAALGGELINLLIRGGVA